MFHLFALTLQWNIDLGQILLLVVGGLLAVVGWFTKKEITSFGRRLDSHDTAIIQLTGNVQRLIGYYEATKNHIDTIKPPSSGTKRRSNDY